jgi:hypothetical protein
MKPVRAITMNLPHPIPSLQRKLPYANSLRVDADRLRRLLLRRRAGAHRVLRYETGVVARDGRRGVPLTIVANAAEMTGVCLSNFGVLDGVSLCSRAD